MGQSSITGPIPGRGSLISSNPARALPSGYVEEEWFAEGVATSFVPVGDLSQDGTWLVAEDDRAAYTTRLLVRRPVDPARHNGTVIVEWLNVTGGADACPEWMTTHRHLTREGFAWVGVSAQRAGVEGGGLMPGPFLKQVDPERYGTLAHPGDQFAFDIFSQAGRRVRDGTGTLLGPLAATRMIAAGESQSATYLTTYLNAVETTARVYDGYLVHSRAGAAAPLDGRGLFADADHLASGTPAPAVRIRDDLAVPVLELQAETDVILLGSLGARQPDTDRFRLWEIAGAAHAETYLLSASGFHDDRTTIEELAALCAPTTTPLGPVMTTASPINSGPQHHYVAQAAIAGLDRWVRYGTPPPIADRLHVADDRRSFVSDEHGIARGGVRTGFVDVPAAVLSGLGQEGGLVGFLFGTTTPLDAGTLQELYPGGRDDYAARFAAATAEAVRAGFVLQADAAEMNALAVAMYPRRPESQVLPTPRRV